MLPHTRGVEFDTKSEHILTMTLLDRLAAQSCGYNIQFILCIPIYQEAFLTSIITVKLRGFCEVGRYEDMLYQLAPLYYYTAISRALNNLKVPFLPFFERKADKRFSTTE